jgi:uncharacterized FlaG/YvyC family protein
MDMQAVKPVSSVAIAPHGKGKPEAFPANSGKNLPPAPPPAARIDPEVVQTQQERQAAVARQMSTYLRLNSRDLEFRVDVETGNAVITVRDAAGNVVRTIPGEEALEMLRRGNVQSGTFVDFTV